MLKAVVYGAVPEDHELLKPLSKKLDVVFEPQPLSDNNFCKSAEVIVVFANSEIKSSHITPSLKAVITRTTGLDHIKCQDELRKRGVSILQAKGYATKSVAEYSFKIIKEEMNSYIASQNVLIVGAGAIGRYLYSLLSDAGIESKLVSASGSMDTEHYSQIGQFVRAADFICIHASLKDENSKLFNAELFSRVKRGAVLINAARGQIVDNNGLMDALDAGIVRKAYLDLVDNDEYRDVVIKHPRVVYTAHTAWKSEESLKASQNYLVTTLEQLAES